MILNILQSLLALYSNLQKVELFYISMNVESFNLTFFNRFLEIYK